ncbi:response regulator [Candidatus Desantisbacteria bacterium]|nr:response regulator [Candidatus Desantisbacteria bacterium]
MPNKILIIDDDKSFRTEFKEYFLNDYDMEEAPDGKTALQLLKSANNIDLIILDIMLPGINGIEVLKDIKKTDPEVKIIILTGYSSKDIAINALKEHADDYLEKPMNIDKTKEIIERLLDIKQLGKNIDTGDISDKIKKAKNFIERNCYKKIYLHDVSRVVGLSSKYLSRIFKENTGVNFSEYKLKIKMGKAKELLTKSGYNVNQISEKLGYENSESFIRQFNKLVKYTPTQYRKKHQKNKKYIK